MAYTFSTFTTAVYALVDNKNASTLPWLKEATVNQLRELSRTRTTFMERTASFATVAGTANYDSGTTGFPANAMKIDRAYYTFATKQLEIRGPVTMDELRFSWESTVGVPYPDRWAWFNDDLYLGPKPNSVVTIYLDYFKDGTKDEATGNAITTSSTTQTNGWFDRGYMALRFAVLAEYFKLPPVQDQEKAAFADINRSKALKVLTDEWHMKAGAGGQAPYNLGDTVELYVRR
jgi:hypothetical protein